MTRLIYIVSVILFLYSGFLAKQALADDTILTLQDGRQYQCYETKEGFVEMTDGKGLVIKATVFCEEVKDPIGAVIHNLDKRGKLSKGKK